MKFLFYAFVVFVSINGILAQYDALEEGEDPRGYGYTSTPIILKKIEETLGSLNHYRNKFFNGAPEKASKYFSQVDVVKMFSEKVEALEAELQNELQKNSNQACNVLFEKKKAQLKVEVKDAPFWADLGLKTILKYADLMEKTLKRMAERVNRYSAEAGDCRVADNAQCELLARYHDDLYDVHSKNVQGLIKEFSQFDVTHSTPERDAEEISQLVAEKIGKPVRECLSRSA